MSLEFKKMLMRFHLKKVFLSILICSFLFVVSGYFLIFQTKKRLFSSVESDTDQKSEEIFINDQPPNTDASKIRSY